MAHVVSVVDRDGNGDFARVTFDVATTGNAVADALWFPDAGASSANPVRVDATTVDFEAQLSAAHTGARWRWNKDPGLTPAVDISQSGVIG